MPHISAVLTGHREGLLAGPSLKSYLAAIANARKNGLTVEPIVVLDRADALTTSILTAVDIEGKRVFETSNGDPGLSRNKGVKESSGRFVCFLDADDLWGHNWLVEAHNFCQCSSTPVIAHSELNVAFGQKRVLWFHVDSAAPSFDPGYLAIGNYWDALCFAPREIFEEYPFRANDLLGGYGYEDWHWNCVTLEAGYKHRPVPGTVNFKRKRPDSQMTKCAEGDVLPWRTKYSLFDTSDGLG